MSNPIIINVIVVALITFFCSWQTIKRRKVEANTLYIDNFTIYQIWFFASTAIPLPLHELYLFGEISNWYTTFPIMCMGLGLLITTQGLKITFSDNHISKTRLFYPEKVYPMKSLLCLSLHEGGIERRVPSYKLEYSFGNLLIPISYINISSLLLFLEDKGFDVPSSNITRH